MILWVYFWPVGDEGNGWFESCLWHMVHCIISVLRAMLRRNGLIWLGGLL